MKSAHLTDSCGMTEADYDAARAEEQLDERFCQTCPANHRLACLDQLGRKRHLTGCLEEHLKFWEE